MFDDVCALLTSMLGEPSFKDENPSCAYKQKIWKSPGEYLSNESCTLILLGDKAVLSIKIKSEKLDDRRVLPLIRRHPNTTVLLSTVGGHAHIMVKEEDADTGALCDLLRVVMPFHEQYRIVEQGRWERRALAHARSMHPRLKKKRACEGLGLVRLL